jgi:glyoxylase-like metal-dependent hydrolase (beta-lactamase superfamily II)
MSLDIKSFFDAETATFTYIVTDPKTKSTAIIDPVLNYDPVTGHISTQSASEIIQFCLTEKLNVQWILETHIHADHISAASFLKSRLGGKIGIGAGIQKILAHWVPIFNNEEDTPLDGSQFDHLFEDNDNFFIGTLNVKVIHTPGHTPSCVSYLIEDAIFTGDTIFSPDLGTARADFPGGSAKTLYNSIQRILSLPPQTRIFVAHDYPTPDRSLTSFITVETQKKHNVLVNDKISETDYITTRQKRDEGKAPPKLLFPSLQMNMRAGREGRKNNGISYIKIPLNLTL